MGERHTIPIIILWDDPMAALDLLQGTLDLLLLRTLAGGPMHGYSASRLIKERSKNVLLVEEGALYPALHRLERKGLVESEWGLSENNRKAKFYQLTASGRAQLRGELAEWQRYTKAVAGVLQPS
jgi:PadR family transcriptional regulator PadR